VLVTDSTWLVQRGIKTLPVPFLGRHRPQPEISDVDNVR
jgi:hypothetical protein